MHGTGTPLGDPIETGAAIATLSSKDRPLRLSAAKSLTGHAEPAAGMVGIVHASRILRTSQSSTLPQLRSLNPHIESLLLQGTKQGQTRVQMPRQYSGQIYGLEKGYTGVSAFAFQGTNAHSVLAAPLGPASDEKEGQTSWQRSRAWFLCRQYTTLYRASSPAKGQVSFACNLQKSALAFLQDHYIQGTALFPGAGMFDMALSAADCLSENKEFALMGVSIAQPLPMTELSGTVLNCNLETSTGKVSIRSHAELAGAGAGKVHLLASIGRPFNSYN